MTDRASLLMQIFDRSHINNPSEHADKSHSLTVAWDRRPERMDFASNASTSRWKRDSRKQNPYANPIMLWRSTILGQPIEQVANALGKQVGGVYASRSRVMRRIRMEIERITDEEG
jgi:hypothetical protein